MNRLFSYGYNGGPFKLFSFPHITAIIVIFLLSLMIFGYRKRLRNDKENDMIRWLLIIVLLGSELSLTLWYSAVGHWSIAYSLPLHLCNLSSFVAAYMLAKKSYLSFEFIYLAGLSGAIQAILTPDLGPYSFPHFCAYEFFIAHGAVVLAGLFMVFVEGYRPKWKSVLNSFVLLNLYALFIGVINRVTGGNYLFLSHKPENPSLLDFLGPWPWYIVCLEGVAILMFILFLSPFLILDRTSKKSIRRDTTQAGSL